MRRIEESVVDEGVVGAAVEQGVLRLHLRDQRLHVRVPDGDRDDLRSRRLLTMGPLPPFP